LPDDLQNVLMSCLRKEPQERLLSIDDLESALRQCVDAGRWSAADALRWWEIELPAAAETATHEDNSGKIGTGKESSRTRPR
jgi:serine/threonine-protein kinase